MMFYSIWKFLSSKDSKLFNIYKLSRKVKLKIRRDDSPREVAANFAKVHGLN